MSSMKAPKKTTKRSRKPQQHSTQKSKNPPNFKIDIKVVFILAFFVLFAIASFVNSDSFQPIDGEKPISEVLSDIKSENVEKLERRGNSITAVYDDGKRYVTKKEEEDSLRKILIESDIDPKDIEVEVKSNSEASIGDILINIVPTILVIAFLIFIFRQARGAQENIFSFGQAKSKRFTKEMSKVTFKHVAGVDEAKKELQEIVDFLKHPKRYEKLGARSPKGVLLVGPAGTGKTLLAKAIAGESNVPFFSIAGSEFMEMLVGIGAARVRDLFGNAKKSAPSIIFIDEIDAIGRTRSVSGMQAHDEREQTLNQILVEMDGFTPNDKVIVVAATNRGDLLDPALLRPGRFDRRVMVDYPDLEGRKAIAKIHAKGKPFDRSVSWDKIARRTVGFSGADIENMLNEGAILAARQNKSKISMEDLEEAATKVKLGPEKRRLQTDQDKEITAYHEGGHAITTHFQEGTDPVHRISIVSRGMSLGHTLTPPSHDRLHYTKTRLLRMIVTMLGGRAAEEIVFKEVTTGASNDFDQATRIAKSMVIDYGMSDLGPVNYGPHQDVTDSGRPMYQQNPIAEETMAKIDAEVTKIIETCYKEALALIKKHRKELNAVAQELIKNESMDEDEFVKIVGKKPGKSPTKRKA